mgnify:CR=1 FL=1
MLKTKFHSIEEVKKVIKSAPKANLTPSMHAQNREKNLTKPIESLGRLEEIAEWLALWQGFHPAKLENVAVHIFAGNHGIAKQGVSAFPQEVTKQMVENFNAGGAAINQLCKANNASLEVFPLDLNNPTADFSIHPALTEPEFITAFECGWKTVNTDLDLLCVGEMGIGNTSSAAAIAYANFGGDVKKWVGPGTGLDGKMLKRKEDLIYNSIKTHKASLTDSIDILRYFGGRELVAMAGAIIAARFSKVPVFLDGYVSTAAASCLAMINSMALDHCKAAHSSQEPGHALLLDRLGLRPILNLDMRLGECSGAAVAINIARCALACHNGMATFKEAGVSSKD